MNDNNPLINRKADGTIDTSNDLLLRDRQDTIVQDNGSSMDERQSYERVIEGLRIAADAAAHLAKLEAEHSEYWLRWQRQLDVVRRAAISIAGIEDPASSNQTAALWGRAMDWRQARDRFREGIKQSAGGMEQLAVCFRSDIRWSQMAWTLRNIVDKLAAITNRTVRTAARKSMLWVPGQE